MQLPTLLAQLDFYQAAQQQNLPGVTANVVNSSDRGFGDFLGNILSGVMVVAALMLLLYLLWGAFDWVTSGGESSKVQKARDKMTQAVIGILVLASSLTIFLIVQSFLGLDFLRFGGSSGTKDSGDKRPSTLPDPTLFPGRTTNVNNNELDPEAIRDAIDNQNNPFNPNDTEGVNVNGGVNSDTTNNTNNDFQTGSASNNNN